MMPELITILSPKSKTKKALVLDLDETLIHTFCNSNPLKDYGIAIKPELRKLYERFFFFKMEDIDGNPGNGLDQMFFTLRRPHLNEFLEFAFSYFSSVNVYSAGTDDYVMAIVRHVFSNFPNLGLVWGRSKCVETESNFFTKPLELMYKLNPDMRPENTLILDDNTNAFITCNPYNGVLIPKYLNEGGGRIITLEDMLHDDIAFLQFKQWLLLDHVMNSTDVRTLDKNNIFNIPLGNPGTSRLHTYTPLINSIATKYTNPVSFLNSANYTPISAFKYNTNFFIQPIRVT